MIDYKKHKSNFSPYLEKLYQSDKPMIIYKYKDGYKIFTDFSKRIALNNSNIEKFLNIIFMTLKSLQVAACSVMTY